MLFCPWDFPGKNTGVSCHFLLQGDLPDSGIEPVSPVLVGGFFNTEPSGMSMRNITQPKKKKAVLPLVTTWMNLKDTMLGETS